MKFELKNSYNQPITLSNHTQIELHVKREDAIHQFVSGNKYRKLKYNLEEAKRLNQRTLLTFGGAFSNHIAATAVAGRNLGFKTIGVIRGEELFNQVESNPTLRFAKQCGMQFKFETRKIYKQKSSKQYLNKLKDEFGDFYLIPEGGTNAFAIKGCEEILTEIDKSFDFICCSVGTGGTISGLINCSKPSQQVLGFPALKGDFLKQDISKFVNQSNWELISDYDFGGYAKINKELISFINEFKTEYKISLDPVYTGKMMYGIFNLLENNYFPKGAKILAIHTGGLQGIEGMNAVLRKKNLPKIE
ncbi:MAG: 1-aminocyclopropane-1-carboxylate deaminase/D-cysteine desulfhydrase [Flaviramulus sp.]|nr:pyridoxal-phosphate dependent enzyme [Flaviramulus sp.]NNC50839.1 1-aminocyclopropane-1-carboxylate deaminase/D-cysteine desulfhydrase [Flaviramulus sp.]